MENIVLGIVSSLVATIIWVCFGYIYECFSAKKKIAILLDLLYDSSDSFDSAIVSENEQLAEIQINDIIKYCIEIFGSMKALTLLGKKRKLFLSVLYNLYYTLTYYKRIFVGSSEDEEEKEKLRKFKRKYYYRVKISFGNDMRDTSFLMLSVVLLQELIQNFSVKKALNHNLYIDDNIDNKYEVYSTLLAYRNMKTDCLKKFDIRRNIFTMAEYRKYIWKKLRGDKTIGMD